MRKKRKNRLNREKVEWESTSLDFNHFWTDADDNDDNVDNDGNDDNDGDNTDATAKDNDNIFKSEELFIEYLRENLMQGSRGGSRGRVLIRGSQDIGFTS